MTSQQQSETHNFILTFDFVVTVSAPEDISTAWCYQFAPSAVVIATTIPFLSRGSGCQCSRLFHSSDTSLCLRFCLLACGRLDAHQVSVTWDTTGFGRGRQYSIVRPLTDLRRRPRTFQCCELKKSLTLSLRAVSIHLTSTAGCVSCSQLETEVCNASCLK